MSQHSQVEECREEHLLLTVLGTNLTDSICYSLNGQRAQAKLAPVALIALLAEPERPDRVLAICTPEAKQKTWPILEQDLGGRCRVASLDVPSGTTQEDIGTYLKHVADAIPESVDLTVDVTHGFRHFSFLTYIAVLYLAALRGVRIRGAYYGLLLGDGASPFLDLRPLLELPRWIHSLDVLHETGSARPMARLLAATPGNQSGTVPKDLSKISESYLSGLPLELGRHASLFRQQRLKAFKKQLTHGHGLPLTAELVDSLDSILEPFALADPGRGNRWKRDVELSKSELKRQARIIDDLIRNENIASALGLMNEWTVSWAILQQGRKNGWLDYVKVRRGSGRLLNALESVGRDSALAGVLTPRQRSLGEFWRLLRELRNAYHHHGMRPEVLVGDKNFAKKLESVREYWKRELRSCPNIDLSLGASSGSTVLVSPIGSCPGVLFSAIYACRADGDDPDKCLVICSRETMGKITEALCRADYQGAVEPFMLEDPFGGSSEIDNVVNAARKHFIGADKVLVNLTGGTTLMGLVAQRLADIARALACPVYRFGLTDRRSPECQEADPFRIGGSFWLDNNRGSDAYRH